MSSGTFLPDHMQTGADDLVTVNKTQPAQSDPSFTSSSSASSTISSGGTTHPFSMVTLVDPGTDATETLTVRFGGGTLSGAGFTQAAVGTYVATGTVAQINADLAGATFTDTFFTSTDAFTKTDYITLNDTGSVNGVPSTGSASLTDLVSVRAQYVSDPYPSFSSTQPTVTLVSGQTTHPLAGVTLSDTNPSGFVPSETLTAVVTGGTFSGTGFTHTTAGTYVATGTAAQINADLAAASFTDTRASGTATDTISLSDAATIAATTGASTHPALTTVSVNVTAAPVDQVPAVYSRNPAQNTAFSGQASFDPLAGVTVADPTPGAQEIAELSISGATGTLSGPGLSVTATGFGYNTYVLSGSPAQVNAELATLNFAPTPGTSGTLGVGIFNLSTYTGATGPVMKESFGFSDTYAAPCYASGTLILTTRGEIVVEALVEGDIVVTASGALRPIRWLGHRRVDCAHHPDPESVRPVRVRAHALGLGVPRRDLVLSPEHALFLDGALVPVRALVDGISIIQEAWARVTYHHVELDSHDILLAEGLAAESYLDTGNRAQFANNTLVTLHASFDSGAAPAEPYAPLLSNGPRLEMLRNALRQRTGVRAA